MSNLKTVKDLKDLIPKKHTYQDSEQFMRELDLESNSGKLFNQSMINKIVLFKVNRYAEIPDHILDELNKISSKGRVIDKELTRSVLHKLLMQKGIRMAMASTILRFSIP